MTQGRIVTEDNSGKLSCKNLCSSSWHFSLAVVVPGSVMAQSHRTGPGQGQGPGNDGFLYYAVYCSHYTGTGTGNHCFLLYPSRSRSLFRSLSRSQSRAVWMSHYTWLDAPSEHTRKDGPWWSRWVCHFSYHVSSLAIVLSSFPVGDHTVYGSDSTGQGGQ